MSATEVCHSLGVQLSAELVGELDEHMAAADEALLLEQAPRAGAKLTLVCVGTTLYAKFIPGQSGSGPCNKKGTGAFASSQVAPSLAGNYSLEVGRITCKLYQGTRMIWSGNGLQKGLSGRWEVKF